MTDSLTWKLEKRKLSDLLPADYNPRILSDKARADLTESVMKFGTAEPVVINVNGVLIGGHQRLKIYADLGMETVDAMVPNRKLSKSEEKELNLRLNKNVGDWDWKKLDEFFSIEELRGVGFSEAELAKTFDTPGKDDDFDVDKEFDASGKPETKYGDIYKLGEHRLMCGDARILRDVEALMAGEQADLVLVDPPYNVDYTGKTKKKLKIENDHSDDEAFGTFLRESFVCLNEVMKPGAVFYIWHADSEGWNFRDAARQTGWQIRQCLIWNKNAMVMGRQDYQWKHEPCLYGWKEGKGHTWNSDRKQTTVLEFDRPSRSKEHPTMKPVELMAYQIGNSSNRGGLVLDTFAGSGSTMVAADQLGRRCFSMELDPRYCDVIVKRWEQLSGRKAERV